MHDQFARTEPLALVDVRGRLLDLIEGDSPSAVIVPTELIVRDST